ncbi:GtrA family protein [Parasulfitobacter algicola]|uniref:GtrA family protein n=1 Tax=Parasulfitobacter algicola TaxID=2614809 RepID=A0ABX2J133_9RHOB|nr:GtrA family protein [Sulfitobacter algicola]NSX56908.1 GtrA family protein [Sulfitobacter algicola]
MFLVIGFAATLTHVIIAISLEAWFDFLPQHANFGGYVSAIGLSYFGHGKITFRVVSKHTIHMPKFIFVSVVGLAIGSGLIKVLNEQNNVHFVYTMVIVGISVASTTFLLSKFWVFAQAQLTQKD